MKNKAFVRLIQIIICSSLLLQCHWAFSADPVDEIPPAKFTLPAPESPQAQKYLGLKAMEPFKVTDIKADLVVVEFMSAVCPHCLANAPMMNGLYKRIGGDSSLAGVKVIAIGSANDKAQLEAYKKNFKVPFPVFLDEDSGISASMEGVPTPTTMIISTQNGKVLFSHTGVIQDTDKFLKELKALHKKK